MATITSAEIIDMVRHWLATPAGAYLGSDYGSDAKALLQSPQSSPLADKFLAKLKRDVPILAALPANSIQMYAAPSGADRLSITIEVAGVSLNIK